MIIIGIGKITMIKKNRKGFLFLFFFPKSLKSRVKRQQTPCCSRVVKVLLVKSDLQISAADQKILYSLFGCRENKIYWVRI